MRMLLLLCILHGEGKKLLIINSNIDLIETKKQCERVSFALRKFETNFLQTCPYLRWHNTCQDF